MTKQNSKTILDQRIFERGLPVHAVSVYLMCTGLSDMGEELTMERLSSVWNGEENDLSVGLQLLAGEGVIVVEASEPVRCRITPFDAWKKT